MIDKATKTRNGKVEDLVTRLERLESFLADARQRPASRDRATRAAANLSTASVLEKRLKALEDRILRSSEAGSDQEEPEAESGPLNYCALPVTPPRVFEPDVSAARVRLIQMVSKKWVNGTKLRYYFFESGPASAGDDQKEIVRQGFDVWKKLGIGIRFEEVQDVGSAEIRIGFVKGDGAWSYVGRDVIDIPGQAERTMNFGWDLKTDPRGVDVPVHEIGHTLGFPHEHQNPFAGLVWDEEAVYRYFGGPPNNWPRSTTEYNILRKLSTSEVEGTQWDPDSIMEYAFPEGLILQPEDYRDGVRPHGGLSPRDSAQAKLFYPPLDDAANPELKPLRSRTLTLAPAEQANFAINPTASRYYTMQTFGGSDTVMVLFEDVDGDLRFKAGDDDSGTNLNSKIKVRLVAGKRYVLRLRMYSSYETGEISVMYW
ncbi:matrixin family metalloprotease [Tundrisphaera lichenicola]|uniref:matrixin family metalloprotease n=1 Tax=Tundrisphaera lichenicola TaxID=2029860 RepID=UPI003EBE3350